MLNTVQSATRLPAILLTIGLRERVLLALAAKPLKMGDLTVVVGTPEKNDVVGHARLSTIASHTNTSHT
mgnify:CR=1 FL=1